MRRRREQAVTVHVLREHLELLDTKLEVGPKSGSVRHVEVKVY
jgi:hypothetical protein